MNGHYDIKVKHVNQNTTTNRPGIVGWQIHIPETYVSQSALETYDGVSEGKYVKGLGQDKMSFADERYAFLHVEIRFVR